MERVEEKVNGCGKGFSEFRKEALGKVWEKWRVGGEE